MKPETEAYVRTLSDNLQRIYDLARYAAHERDTLSDDFQIAAEVEDVFKKYAKRSGYDGRRMR